MELMEQQVLNQKRPILGMLRAPQSSTINQDLGHSILAHRKDFDSSLNTLLGNDQEESKIKKARAVLGKTVTGVPDDELAVYLTEFQYLLDDWLDSYEQQIFNAKTLQQLQGEG